MTSTMTSSFILYNKNKTSDFLNRWFVFYETRQAFILKTNLVKIVKYAVLLYIL